MVNNYLVLWRQQCLRLHLLLCFFSWDIFSTSSWETLMLHSKCKLQKLHRLKSRQIHKITTCPHKCHTIAWWIWATLFCWENLHYAAHLDVTFDTYHIKTFAGDPITHTTSDSPSQQLLYSLNWQQILFTTVFTNKFVTKFWAFKILKFVVIFILFIHTQGV